MTKYRILLASLVVLFVFAAMPSASRAFDGLGGSPWDVRAFGYSGTLYGLGYLPVPPYFAVHPPVYYGERYYRSYGESPFARPDRSSRPLRISAQVIINPYVGQAAVGQAAPELPAIPVPEQPAPVQEAQTTVGPQVIINPFYKADEVAQK